METKIQCYKSSLSSPPGAPLMTLALLQHRLCQKCRPLGPAQLPSPAQGLAENTLLNVTLLFSSLLPLFHRGWKEDSEADNYIADVGFLEENGGKL